MHGMTEGTMQRDWEWLRSLVRRHRTPCLLANAQGEPVFSLVGYQAREGWRWQRAPRAYARVLCGLAVQLFPDPSGTGPRGERIHQTPIHAGERMTLITIGSARTHEVLVADVIPHLVTHAA
jgi:hypothetical protein